MSQSIANNEYALPSCGSGDRIIIVAALLAQMRQLHSDLHALADRDPEQEVRGTAELTLRSIMSEARESLPAESTLRDQIIDLISPESIEAGDPVRVADALIVVGQILAVLEYEERKKPTATISVPRGHIDDFPRRHA